MTDILISACIILLVTFFGWVVVELSNQIDTWRIKYNKMLIQLKGRDESILRLDMMLLESIDGQLALMKYLENFNDAMTPEAIEKLKVAKMKLQRTKEIHVERWKEFDENRVASSKVDE